MFWQFFCVCVCVGGREGEGGVHFALFIHMTPFSNMNVLARGCDNLKPLKWKGLKKKSVSISQRGKTRNKAVGIAYAKWYMYISVVFGKGESAEYKLSNNFVCMYV